MAAANGDVLHHVQSERRFSLRRPRGQNEQLGRLQAGGELIQFRVAGGNASDAFAFLEDFFQALKIVANDVLDGNQAGADAVFGQSEDRGFRAVENGVGAVFAFKGALLDLVRSVNQVAQHGFFFDDARVMLDVRDAGHAIGQGSEIRRAAGSF